MLSANYHKLHKLNFVTHSDTTVLRCLGSTPTPPHSKNMTTFCYFCSHSAFFQLGDPCSISVVFLALVQAWVLFCWYSV